jgi:hypothetical protein
MKLVHRAIDDLREGIGSLFGSGGSRPELLEELLGEARQRRASPRRERPRGHLRVVRSRTPRKSHLVRVK